MNITENLDTFLADFGETVVCGAVSGVGILDSPDQDMAGGLIMSSEYSVLVKWSLFSAVNVGASITVAGVSYTVRKTPEKVDDGVFCKIQLSKAS